MTPSPSVSSTGPNAVASSDAASPRPTVLPDPKHEIYGFVPYWEMDDTIADHIAETDLTTLGLFSVTHRRERRARRAERLQRIRGDVGRRHDPRSARPRARGSRSCTRASGRPRTGASTTSRRRRTRWIEELVGLVDGARGRRRSTSTSRRLPIEHVPTTARSSAGCATRSESASPDAQVSVATQANEVGAAMAARPPRRRRRPDLPHGLRLPLGGLAAGRVGADRPARWRAQGPRLVARPVRGARRAGRPDAARAAAVRDDVAGRSAPASGRPSTGRGDAWVPRRNLRGLRRSRRSRRRTSRPRASSSMSSRPRSPRPSRRPNVPGVPAECQPRADRAGTPSTTTLRAASRRSFASPTSAGWPVPGSGRSATSAAYPTTRGSSRRSRPASCRQSGRLPISTGRREDRRTMLLPSIDDHLRTAIRLATDNVAAGQFPFAGAGRRRRWRRRGRRRPASTPAGATRDPAAHGEVEAIRAACRRLGTFDLSGTIVVSSCHPCPICQAVAGHRRGSRGSPTRRTREQAAAGGFGFSDGDGGKASTTVDGAMVTELEHVAIDGAASAPFDAWLASDQSVLDAAPGRSTRLRVAVTAHGPRRRRSRSTAMSLGLPQLADWSSPDGKGRRARRRAGDARAHRRGAGRAASIAIEVGRRVAGPVRCRARGRRLGGGRSAHAPQARCRRLLGEGPVDTPWGDRNVRLTAPADLQLTLFTKTG